MKKYHCDYCKAELTQHEKQKIVLIFYKLNLEERSKSEDYIDTEEICQTCANKIIAFVKTL